MSLNASDLKRLEWECSDDEDSPDLMSKSLVRAALDDLAQARAELERAKDGLGRLAQQLTKSNRQRDEALSVLRMAHERMSGDPAMQFTARLCKAVLEQYP